MTPPPKQIITTTEQEPECLGRIDKPLFESAKIVEPPKPEEEQMQAAECDEEKAD